MIYHHIVTGNDYRKSPFLIGKPYFYGPSSIHQKSLIRKKQNRFSHVSHAGVVG